MHCQGGGSHRALLAPSDSPDAQAQLQADPAFGRGELKIVALLLSLLPADFLLTDAGQMSPRF